MQIDNPYEQIVHDPRIIPGDHQHVHTALPGSGLGPASPFPATTLPKRPSRFTRIRHAVRRRRSWVA